MAWRNSVPKDIQVRPISNMAGLYYSDT